MQEQLGHNVAQLEEFLVSYVLVYKILWLFNKGLMISFFLWCINSWIGFHIKDQVTPFSILNFYISYLCKFLLYLAADGLGSLWFLLGFWCCWITIWSVLYPLWHGKWNFCVQKMRAFTVLGKFICTHNIFHCRIYLCLLMIFLHAVAFYVEVVVMGGIQSLHGNTLCAKVL